MPTYRLQVSWAADTAFPRDRLVITPHFHDEGALTDPQNLCDDLLAGLLAWTTMGPRDTRVTAYDAAGPPPHEPLGLAEVVGLTPPASTQPREVAVCLSFFSGSNTPRRRGRLYIPLGMIQNISGGRPSTPVRQKVADLAPIFEGLGGPDVDWCVYSRADATPRPVTNWWVDDEWDTIRSRGLRPTTRLAGTTAEA